MANRSSTQYRRPPGMLPARRGRPQASRSLLLLSAGGLLITGLACLPGQDGGGTPLADGKPPAPLRVDPGAILVAVGQSTRFTTTLPGGGRALWSVIPAAAGSIDADGVFSPGGSLGQCTVTAAWSLDPRVAGSAGVTVVAAPLAAATSPDLSQAAGTAQTGAGGAVANAAVVGEGLAVATATAAGGSIQVRHGFYPPTSADGP